MKGGLARIRLVSDMVHPGGERFRRRFRPGAMRGTYPSVTRRSRSRPWIFTVILMDR